MIPIKRKLENRLKNLSINPIPHDTKFIGKDDGDKLFM